MDISKRALMNSQSGLSTVSHNIASKDVEGYSRQRVELVTNPPVSEGNLQFGTGARISRVSRINDEFLEKQIEQEQSKTGMAQGRAETLARVENVFNDQNRKGMNQFITEFFNAFREFSNTPDSQATRELVKQAGKAVVQDFQRLSRQMKDVQMNVDQQIKDELAEINAMTKEISNLNEKIVHIEISGNPANDQRDRRDELVKKLGEKVNIKYTEGDGGKITVTMGGNAILVSGDEAATLRWASTPEKGDKREGNFDVIYDMGGTDAFAVTDQIKGGKLGGSIDIRDKAINKLMDRIDEIAYTLAEKVNEAHSLGVDRYGFTGQKFFDLQGPVRGAAERIGVAREIERDVWKINAGSAPGAPGDNRVSNLIAGLQYERFMDNGASTINDYYNGIVSQMAVDTKQANSTLEYQNNVLMQLKNIRENISGVNLDEEAVKMVEYQKAFDASAKLIKTADEMLETVLSIKR